MAAEHYLLLQAIFPNAYLKRVRFRMPMPWFMFTRKSYKAITLPTTYGLRGITIYFRDFEDYNPSDIATLVHEIIHVKQAQRVWGGFGLGLFRPFVIRYLAEHLRSGYRDNPLEKDAYHFDDKIEAYCRQVRKQYPNDNTRFMTELVDGLPEHLVAPEPHHERKAGPLRMLLGTLMSLGFALGKPLADLLMLVATGLAWLVVGLTWPFRKRRVR